MLRIKQLKKEYKNTKALNDINLEFPEKGLIFIIGKSGSGKSTLLNVIGGLDRYDSGDIIINDGSSKEFSNTEWDLYRNTYIGFVFQDFNLLDKLTVFDNIKLSLSLQGLSNEESSEKTLQLLREVELLDKKDNLTSELSGGQNQRVAIARALVKNPSIILADEPTGNLDSETSAVILNILKEMSKDRLVIMVTHDTEYSNKYADRIIELKDGKVIKDFLNKSSIDSSIKINNASKIHKIDTLNDEVKEVLKPYLKDSDTHILTSPSIKYVSDYLEESIVEDDIYNDLHSNENSFGLVKSKLPFKYIINMIIKSLKLKKFKLVTVFTTFTISLTLFSFTLLFLSYDDSSVLEEAIPNSETIQFSFNNKRDDLGNVIGESITYNYIENLKLENEDAVFGYYDDYAHSNIFVSGGYNYSYEYGSYADLAITRYLSYSNTNVLVDELENIPHKILAGNKVSTENNAILIPDFIADYILLSEKYDQSLENYDDIIDKTVNQLTNIELNENTSEYKIIGIYETNLDSAIRNTVNSDYGVHITEQILLQYSIYVKRDYTNDEIGYSAISGVFIDGDADLALEIINEYEIYGNVLFMNIIEMGERTNSISTILIIAMIIFTVIAVTLMYQYISTTIQYRKKEIGTLRALGARKFDIFKAYFIETLLIMLVVLIFTTIALIIAMSYINKQYAWQTASSFEIFYLSSTMKILVVGFSILVSFISSYYPIRTITKLKPIDAIRNTRS